MLFSDSGRFDKAVVSNRAGDIQGFTASTTEEHIGPGAYLSSPEQDKRSGWQRKSFSTRKNPMVSSVRGNRSDSYVHGCLSPRGIMASPRARADRDTPGPGYYEGTTGYMGGGNYSPRPGSTGLRAGSPRARLTESMRTMNFSNAFSSKGGSLPTSPRFSFQNSSCVRGEVMFQSKMNEDKSIGPGYYDVSRDSMLKKSHNVRARASELNHSKREHSSFNGFGANDSDYKLFSTQYSPPAASASAASSPKRSPQQRSRASSQRLSPAGKQQQQQRKQLSPKQQLPEKRTSKSGRFFSDSPVGTPDINLSADSAEADYYRGIMRRQSSRAAYA